MLRDMKTFICAGVGLAAMAAGAAEWRKSVSITDSDFWGTVPTTAATAETEMTIDFTKTDQTFVGFGTAISELSWDALAVLSETDRKAVLDEMFLANGAGFTIIRTPIGSSDFSRDYYSYNDNAGDLEMKKFSLEIDERALLPLLREIKARVKPEDFLVWGSPWCPPRWMKTSGHYASIPPWASNNPTNDCPYEESVFIGEDAFICDQKHFAAYAKYFRLYVDAMKEKGFPLWMVMPQNEPCSAQPYPSCTWRGRSLAEFTVDYLGPALAGSGTEIYMGTIEERSIEKVRDVLDRTDGRKYVTGAGFQWEGRCAIGAVHRRYPDLTLVMTEHECNAGKNDRAELFHSWNVARTFLGQGASYYNYWNLALTDDQRSRWGWPQNSLVTVDRKTRKVTYNREYYLMKMLSTYIRKGATRLLTRGDLNELAFRNADGTAAVLFANDSAQPKIIAVKIDGRKYTCNLLPFSISAFAE